MSRQYQRGMTLLEVLVAITLMVIISTITYASLNGLINAKTHTDKVSDKVRQELLLSQQISKDIHAMINRNSKDEFGGKENAVIGMFSSIKFNRLGNANLKQNKQSELQRIHWYLRDNQLIRTVQNFVDMGSFTRPTQRAYLDNVSDFRISYVNLIGKKSTNWPISSNNSGPEQELNQVLIMIEYNDGTELNFVLNPNI